MAMAADGDIGANDDNTMWGLIKKGGPVMIPLGIASVLALALGIERFISLGKDRILPEAFVTEFGEAWEAMPAESPPKRFVIIIRTRLLMFSRRACNGRKQP